MVEFKDVSVTYSSGVDALNKINLKINDGDFAFVVGSNGAGKSTLIKLILKEIDATEGTVIANGYNLKKIRRSKISKLRRTIGVVFQDFRLIPTMTVYENIAFVLRVIDAPKKYIKTRVPYALELVGLSDKMKAYPDQLSGGEQQRVSIARALAKRPKLLLCDEPTGALDYNTGKSILKLLQQTCREEKMTVVLITHNQAITPMADRVIRMKSGKVIENTVNHNPLDVESIEW